MTNHRGALACALFGLLAGCAHTPPATIAYHLPTTNVSFKVIRTVACDAEDNPIIVTGVTPTVRHVADASKSYEVPLAGLRGQFSDTDVKFDFYEDGRLSGVNATSTGQGEAVLKTVITIATAILGLDGGSMKRPEECAKIRAFGGGKPLTLTFEGPVDLSQRDEQPLLPDTSTGFYAHELREIVGGACATVLGTRAGVSPATYTKKAGDVLLQARQPGSANVKITAGPKEGCRTDKVWEDSVVAAQFGTEYGLPIPAAAMFGKQVFAAAFAESGALKSVQYASNTGAAQVLNVGSAALNAVDGSNTAEKVAETKAEADLILQQQRLATCLADPANCK